MRLLLFQFTQPKRAATCRKVVVMPVCCLFQFTQPKRAATDYTAFAPLDILFQFTQPKRAATSVLSKSQPVTRFQFTQPKRAATRFPTCARCAYLMFQFTQPKRAATLKKLICTCISQVSIHAAQAGCDESAVSSARLRYRFNSRSPSGLRPCGTAFSATYLLFQFTQPKRAATTLLERAHIIRDVSIHAAQAGCDRCILRRSKKSLLFQFTQPKRAATCITAWRRGFLTCFNSRSPSGLRPMSHHFH